MARPITPHVLIQDGGAGGGGVSGLSTADGGTAIADNKVIRGDGTTGIQASALELSDAGVLKFGTYAGIVDNGVSGLRLCLGDGTSYSGVTVGALQDDHGGTNKLHYYAGTLSLFIDTTGPVLRFSRSVNAQNAHDSGIATPSAGEIRITDGSTGIGSLSAKQTNEASLAGSGSPNILTAVESGKTITNTGATAECYNTLPAATNIGCWFKFVCMDTDGIRATAAGSDTIRYAANVSAAGGFVRSLTVGAVFTVECVASGQWYVISTVGTVNTPDT